VFVLWRRDGRLARSLGAQGVWLVGGRADRPQRARNISSNRASNHDGKPDAKWHPSAEQRGNAAHVSLSVTARVVKGRPERHDAPHVPQSALIALWARVQQQDPRRPTALSEHLCKGKGRRDPASRRLRAARRWLGVWRVRHAIAREIGRWPNQASRALTHGLCRTAHRFPRAHAGVNASTPGIAAPARTLSDHLSPCCPFQWDGNSPLTAPRPQGGAAICVGENVPQSPRPSSVPTQAPHSRRHLGRKI